MRRLLEALPPGGVLAVQMPDNTSEPSHQAIEEVAAQRLGPALAAAVRERLALPPAADYYDLLAPAARRVDIWHAIYNHVLEDVPAIVEWVKGSRLRPCLDALDGAAREAFVAAYTARLADLYPRRVDGKISSAFPASSSSRPADSQRRAASPDRDQEGRARRGLPCYAAAGTAGAAYWVSTAFGSRCRARRAARRTGRGRSPPGALRCRRGLRPPPPRPRSSRLRTRATCPYRSDPDTRPRRRPCAARAGCGSPASTNAPRPSTRCRT